MFSYISNIQNFEIKVEETLGEYANLFKDHYYIKSSGNCDLSRMSDPHNEFKGKNVLIERKDVASMASKCGKSVDDYCHGLAECRKSLFEVRSKRPRPHLDDKVAGFVISSIRSYHFIWLIRGFLSNKVPKVA